MVCDSDVVLLLSEVMLGSSERKNPIDELLIFVVEALSVSNSKDSVCVGQPTVFG